LHRFFLTCNVLSEKYCPTSNTTKSKIDYNLPVENSIANGGTCGEHSNRFLTRIRLDLNHYLVTSGLDRLDEL
jgi:hypothetical protein